MLLVCVLLTSSLLGAIGAVDTGFSRPIRIQTGESFHSHDYICQEGHPHLSQQQINHPMMVAVTRRWSEARFISGPMLPTTSTWRIALRVAHTGGKHDQAYHNSFLRKRTALADDTLDQVFCFQSGNLSSSCLGQLFAFPTTISNQRKIISWKMANFTWISEVWGTCEDP